MKKILYYASPFIVFPMLFWADDLLKKIDIFYNAYEFIIACIFVAILLFCALIGSLSATNKKFDYLITAIIPISFFLTLFFALYCEEVYDFVRFSLHHALSIEYYRDWLPCVSIMTAITFITSFKPIRLSKKLSNIDRK